MLITFEPNVAQRSVASQNDHKSMACLPEASNTAFTMYYTIGALKGAWGAFFFAASTVLVYIHEIKHKNKDKMMIFNYFEAHTDNSVGWVKVMTKEVKLSKHQVNL